MVCAFCLKPSRQFDKIKIITRGLATRFSPTNYGNFYPQILVPDPQKLEARVLSDACLISPASYLFIYGFIVWRISGLKSKSYQCFGSTGKPDLWGNPREGQKLAA